MTWNDAFAIMAMTLAIIVALPIATTVSAVGVRAYDRRAARYDAAVAAAPPRSVERSARSVEPRSVASAAPAFGSSESARDADASAVLSVDVEPSVARGHLLFSIMATPGDGTWFSDGRAYRAMTIEDTRELLNRIFDCIDDIDSREYSEYTSGKR